MMPSKLDMELLFGIIHQDVKVRGKKRIKKKGKKDELTIILTQIT